jgi:hypothetical protein
MGFVKSIDLTSIKDYTDKAKACEALSFKYKLEGTLREFTYDIVEEGNIIGSLSSITEKTSYLKEYRGLNESDLSVRHIRANDDPYLPKEDIIELDVIVWQNRFFIFELVEIELYA